jgi:putative ABC transport system permease protein
MNQYFKDVRLFLQPITDIHLYSNYLNDQVAVGHIKYIYIMATVAFFILLIACINFINLSTARILTRAKEIGVRKVIGSGKLQIVLQFFCESILFVFISFICSLILVEMLVPYANNFLGKNISLNFLNSSHILMLSVLVLFTSLLAGIPQALYYSTNNPIFVLKSEVQLSSKKSFIRKTLIITQFTISIGLIIATIIIHQQVNFMTNKNLGFDKTNILYIPVKGNIGKQYDVAKKHLLKNPQILNVTAKDYMPTDQIITNMIFSSDKKHQILSEITRVDQDYIKTLGITLLDGENFSEQDVSNAGNYVIVDEQIVNALNLDSPTGKQIYIGDQEVNIKGVAANSYFRSVKNKVLYPQTYIYLNDLSKQTTNGTILIKVSGHKLDETIAYVERFWQSINPDSPFEYHFLDSLVDKIYNEELQMEAILHILTVLVILTTCLGLFGLATFMTERKTKEIGIRKVFGASVFQIVYLLSKNFSVLILIANLFAAPVIFFIMKTWLQDYTYHIEINLWVFILSGAIALFIAMVTISWQAMRAATANPVESLRYE